MNEIEDYPEEHVELSERCMPRKVLMSPELMNTVATRTVDGYRVHWRWGKPDADGFYAPILMIDRNDKI